MSYVLNDKLRTQLNYGFNFGSYNPNKDDLG